MKVAQIKFLVGAMSPAQFPAGDLPEVAFAGRSNVGKSSLINALLGRRSVARTSRSPGKTREINFFSLDDRARFVDLPGFGYAKGGASVRGAWQKTIEAYMSSRKNLRTMVLLVDGRRGLEEEELQLLDYARHVNVRVDLVLTKADKLNQKEKHAATRAMETHGYAAGDYLFVSALKGSGLKELWQRLDDRLFERAG